MLLQFLSVASTRRCSALVLSSTVSGSAKQVAVEVGDIFSPEHAATGHHASEQVRDNLVKSFWDRVNWFSDDVGQQVIRQQPGVFGIKAKTI